MIYFDSDVLFNYLVIQDVDKHKLAKKLVIDAIEKGSFVISTLVIQEVGYGMARQEITNEEIEEKLTALSGNLVGIGQADIIKGLQFAKKIGFKHINDCVHTAVAENLNCDIFYTYNKSDFKRIQKHTDLRIKIL